MKKIHYLSLILFFLFSCSPARFVKPLNKHQHAANLSLGGELIKYGKATIPIPFLTAGYGYGIDRTLTGFASVNITSALFGNLHVDVGANKQVSHQKKYLPAISVSPVVTFLYRNLNATRVYPQLGVYAFWEYGKGKNYFYTGIDNWFELSSRRALNRMQRNNWILTPLVGHCFGGKYWSFNAEIKVIAPYLSNEKLVVEYQTPFKNHGAFGVYVGVTKKF